jgi:hypothetical protein
VRVTRRALWPLLLLAAAATCCAPPKPGYFQFAEIEAAPERECVRQTVESLADPGSVFAQQDTRDWIFEYTRAGARYGVQISPSAAPPFFAHYAWGDAETPAETLRTMRERLREVTRAVQDRCGLPGLAARVKEQCVGAHCAELEAH